MELLCHLLPDSKNLQLDNWQLEKTQANITLNISSTQTVVNCPVCQFSTHRIHSHYERTLSDLPWADYSIILQLYVRKFFCINPLCKRRIFTERLSSVAPWARRTRRLNERLTAIGLANGGAAGSRLSQRLGLRASRNTLLNLVRRIPLPLFNSLKIIGVDDFCFRKCKTYGTIVVDLETNKPVTLLKDRSAETLSSWLKEHPGIKIVSRDRAKAYEKGIKSGAPDAIQVADRFHLLQNLAQTLYEVFGIHSKEIKTVEEIQNPSLREGIELAEDFISLVRQRQASELDSWLISAYNSILSPFSRFAKSLFEDYRAVKAAVTMSWSNGPVEGQINRLKMLKRQMYGRAKIDLLTKRFLLQI